VAAALAALNDRAFATGEQHFVFASDTAPDRPIAPDPLRAAFTAARELAGVKPIKMYNLRHSFGTSLAATGIDVRTIQALMRHDRLTTTEQYMAYMPRPELANLITAALTPQVAPDAARPSSGR
jgi:site-specific recombinase XerD